MAKTFYGYQDRRGANQVNWEGLATNAADSLKAIAADRQNKKQELDEVNRSLITAANDVEMGQNQTFNQFALDGSNQTKEFLLMQNKLLKKGLLNPNDYSKSMQTVKDDWGALSKSVKKFNEVYDEAFKRLNDGTMAAEEAFKKENLFKFGNVQDKGIFVNPVDGRLYIAEKDAKGRLITDPEKLVNVAGINDMMNEKVEKFDVITNVNKGVAKMAEIVKVLRKNNVLTLKDARQNPMYKKAKEDFIASMLANPKNTASVLADYLGGYEFTYDKNKAGGNTIYLKRDGGGVGQPQLTPAQEKAAKEALDAVFETQIEQIETPMPVFAPQRPLAGRSGGDDDEMMFAYGNALEIAAGTANAPGLVQALAKNPNSPVANIAAGQTEITVEFKDGRIETISRVNQDGSPMSNDQVAQAIFPYLDPRANPAKVADVAGKYNQKYKPQFEGNGTFGQRTYRSIDDLTAIGTVAGQPASIPVRSAIMSVDPEAKDAFVQVDAFAKKINPRVSVTPASKSGYVDISYPGTTKKSFPLKSTESLSRISNYLEQLNQYIFNQKSDQPTPASGAPAGTKPKAY